MIGKNQKKSGAALVIALGFLAVLTIMVIAFSLMTRSERLAARSYLTSAQTRQLLHTALSKSMQEIDLAANTNYPSSFLALGSLGDTQDLLADTLNFSTADAYIQMGNTELATEYRSARGSAAWETVRAPDNSGQDKAIAG